MGSIKKGLNEGYPAFSIQQLTFFILQQVSIQGKLCQLDDVCEKPPEFFYLAFDGKSIQEHGKTKVGPETKAVFIYVLCKQNQSKHNDQIQQT